MRNVAGASGGGVGGSGLLQAALIHGLAEKTGRGEILL